MCLKDKCIMLFNEYIQCESTLLNGINLSLSYQHIQETEMQTLIAGNTDIFFYGKTGIDSFN